MVRSWLDHEVIMARSWQDMARFNGMITSKIIARSWHKTNSKIRHFVFLIFKKYKEYIFGKECISLSCLLAVVSDLAGFRPDHGMVMTRSCYDCQPVQTALHNMQIPRCLRLAETSQIILQNLKSQSNRKKEVNDNIFPTCTAMIKKYITFCKNN